MSGRSPLASWFSSPPPSVAVEIGARRVTGCVVAGPRPLPADDAPAGLKPVLRVLDAVPLIPGEVIELARWTAEYYLCGPGETMAAALPPMARRRAHAFKQQRVARLTDAGRAADLEALTARQRDVVRALAAVSDGRAVADLVQGGSSAAVVARMAEKGLIEIAVETVERDPFVAEAGTAAAGTAGADPLSVGLTEEQAAAVARLETMAASGTFGVAVLHGVTGSGKTQVYLRVADGVRRAGRRVLILVPEIALTPAMAALFRRAFGARVAIQHSGLSEGERHDQWHRIRRGEVDVVVGTRSAIFAPVENLGLIVVDEEHDTSYKQDESPRYHGRDVAVVRARLAGALAILGSATPALETYGHAQSGRYTLVELGRRILDRPLASVRIVDMREVLAAEGPEAVLSAPLREALAGRLAAGEQSVVLLNRRGYANALFCRQCAATLGCPNCSITLTVHRTAREARCHYCDHAMHVPERCRACGGEFLDYRGVGTERIEAVVRELLPGARVARLDRDAVRRRGTIADVLRRFAARELDVLVGTQMIAKGHDFPEVTLVGVISADVGLGVADFRAAERTFQLLTQVVGRAGRGERRGEAIIQTLYPDHYSIALASRQDYRGFFDAELVYRRAMHYPPTLSLVNVIVRAGSSAEALRDAARLARALRHADGRFEVLGPAAAPLPKLRGDYRAQLFLKGRHRAAMRQAIQAALEANADLGRRATVDVDPLTVL